MVPSQHLRGNKEDPSFLIKRIMLSNSGQFDAFSCDGQPIKERPIVQKESKFWDRYKDHAEAAVKNGNFSQAESMWLNALSEAKNFDQKDDRLVFTLENLTRLYCALGRFEQAEMFCNKALDATRAIYGDIHVKVANCLNNLSGIYYNEKRIADAEPLCLRVLYIYETMYGPDHVDVGMAANNLAMIYHALAKYEKAQRLYERAWHIRRRALGENHPSLRTLRQNYDNLLCAMDSSANLSRLPPKNR